MDVRLSNLSLEDVVSLPHISISSILASMQILVSGGNCVASLDCKVWSAGKQASQNYACERDET